jgi:hypothetical protein
MSVFKSGFPSVTQGHRVSFFIGHLIFVIFDAPISRPMAMGLSVPLLRSSMNGRARPCGPPSVDPSVHPFDQNARGDPLSDMLIQFQNCPGAGPSQETVWQKMKIMI